MGSYDKYFLMFQRKQLKNNKKKRVKCKNCELTFYPHNWDFITRNCDFISINSDFLSRNSEK